MGEVGEVGVQYGAPMLLACLQLSTGRARPVNGLVAGVCVRTRACGHDPWTRPAHGSDMPVPVETLLTRNGGAKGQLPKGKGSTFELGLVQLCLKNLGKLGIFGLWGTVWPTRKYAQYLTSYYLKYGVPRYLYRW